MQAACRLKNPPISIKTAHKIEFLIRNEISNDILNVGSNEVVSIKELSKLIQKVVGFKGNLVFNQEYPDGNPKKLLDEEKSKEKEIATLNDLDNLDVLEDIKIEDLDNKIGDLYMDNQLPFLFHLSGGNEEQLIKIFLDLICRH